MSAAIVAELSAWLARATVREDVISYTLILQTRDRMVALLQMKTLLQSQVDAIRAAALEEAAQACVGSGAIVKEARLCAAAIRALKENHHE